jgi:hypothetical protein
MEAIRTSMPETSIMLVLTYSEVLYIESVNAAGYTAAKTLCGDPREETIFDTAGMDMAAAQERCPAASTL